MFENLFHRNAYYALKVAKHFSFYWKMHASLPPHFFSQKASEVLHFGNVRCALQPQFGGQLLKCRTKVWQNQKSHFLPICPRTETSIIYGMISPKLRCKCSIQGVLYEKWQTVNDITLKEWISDLLWVNTK